MIHAMSGDEAIRRRHVVLSPGTGVAHWGSEYFGERWPDESVPASASPQALMAELSADETVLAHFHGVTQFQVFAAGSGVMGRNDVQPLTIQFKDHHTAYGPVIAGPQGLTFFTMRMKTANASPVYLNKPGYKEKLQPSKRRNLLSPRINFSTEPVLMNRTDAVWEPVSPYDQFDDGLAAHVVRLGAGKSVMGPDPEKSSGHYLFVGNGNLDLAGENFPLWSMVVVTREEKAMEIKAGDKGLEVLVLEFPIEE